VALTDCPNCRAQLRLPERATHARCPACKTIFPLAKPAPPPPRKPVVEELPPDDEPKGKAKGKKRPLTILEEDRRAYERQQRIKEERAAEERERDRDQFAAYRPARQGVFGLAVGFWCYAGAVMLLAASPLAALTDISLIPSVVSAAAVLGVLNLLATFAGLGLCLAGPRHGRGLAACALAACLVHAGVLFALPADFKQAGIVDATGDVKQLDGVGGFFLQIGAATMLWYPTVMAPLKFADQGVKWVFVIVALAELTRLVMLAVLLHMYADYSIEKEPGYRSARFITKVFYTLGIAAVLLGSFGFGWAKTAPDTTSYVIVRGLFGVTLFGFMFTFAILLLVQGRNAKETVELIDHRLVDTGKWVIADARRA
jgi:LSD1 subclass zinc finger protein